MATYRDFFSDVITGLGGKPTEGALEGLAGLVVTEGANKYYNPWNIEWHPGANTAWKGSFDVNGPPYDVQGYPSYDYGVKATITFMEANSGWHEVIQAMKSGNKSDVESALTNVYTWAPFHTADSARAQSILNESLGSSKRTPVIGGSGPLNNNKGSVVKDSGPSLADIIGGIESGAVGLPGAVLGHDAIKDSSKWIAGSLTVIGEVFGKLLWIFNVDHFMKFLLYTFGAIAVATGLGLISFGAGTTGEGEG